MNISVHTKTITEVDAITGDFIIDCFADMNQGGSFTPSVFKSQVLFKPMIIDNMDGKEGELMLSHDNEPKVGKLTADGDLILDLEKDDANKYEKQNENLIYNE